MKLFQDCLVGLIIGTLLVLACLQAAESQVVQCGPTELAHYTMVQQGQLPLLYRESGEVYQELWVNPETGTYTVIAYPDYGVACFVGMGQRDDFIQYPA